MTSPHFTVGRGSNCNKTVLTGKKTKQQQQQNSKMEIMIVIASVN